jgi:sirohydrochlorin cobaltochelatase
MNSLYTETKTYLTTTVEGFSKREIIMKQMKRNKVTKVLLKPLISVAGDHAHNDIATSTPKSIKSILTQNGFQTTTVMQGMGGRRRLCQYLWQSSGSDSRRQRDHLAMEKPF